MRVAIATCRQIPEPDVDETLLLEALRGAGLTPSLLAWDDPDADFAGHDLVVVRSTWNYYEHLDAFRAWIERTAAKTRLLNPATVLLGNVVKTYLRDLDARGIATVPTVWVAKGERADVGSLMDAHGFAKIVIKPVVSAGSFRTASFTRERAAEAQVFLDALAHDRDAMIQRWMTAVDDVGERSLVWIDGAFTHAIRKSPRFAGGAESVSGELPIEADERAFGEAVLAPIAGELLYARVDTIRDGETLRVMELELVEPSLFFKQCPRALERFVAAVARRR